MMNMAQNFLYQNRLHSHSRFQLLLTNPSVALDASNGSDLSLSGDCVDMRNRGSFFSRLLNVYTVKVKVEISSERPMPEIELEECDLVDLNIRGYRHRWWVHKIFKNGKIRFMRTIGHLREFEDFVPDSDGKHILPIYEDSHSKPRS